MSIKFVKMQGLGNDYVYVNAFEQYIQDPNRLAKEISDRHFGVGSDGLVMLMPPSVPDADLRMRMFNSDGTEAEMCGNAIRCVGKLAYESGLCGKNPLRVETKAGVKTLELFVSNGTASGARVDMGKPELAAGNIPVAASDKNARFISEPVCVDGKKWLITAVSMGNPHAVTRVDSVDDVPLASLVPRLETHPLFPAKTNVEFVQIIDDKTVRMRVWERGAGETLACGTGSCATLVACVLNGWTARKAEIRLLGGSLFVEWDETTGHVFMTGPAVRVFEGVWS